MVENLYILFNLCLYLALYKVYNKHFQKCFNPGHIVLICWIFVAFMGILYYNSGGLYQNYRKDVSLFPFIAEFILFLIAFYPFFKIQWNKKFCYTKESPLLMPLIYFTILVTILPFMESVIQLFSSETTIANSVEQYQMREVEGETLIRLSYLGNKCYHWASALKLISPILLFYYLSFKKVKIWVVIGLLMASFITCVYGLVLGNRGPALNTFIYIFFIYIAFRNNLNVETRKKVQKVGFIMVGAVATYLILMTIIRYAFLQTTTNDTTSLYDWISKYLGEPFINMNCDSFWNENYLWGELTNPTLWDFFTGNPARDRWILYDKIGIRTHVLYTSFGQLFLDFPYMIVAIITIIPAWIMYVIRNSVIRNIGAFICWCGFANLLLEGIFIYPLLNSFMATLFAVVIGVIIFKTTN